MINILLNGCNGNMGNALKKYIKNSSQFNILYGIDKDNTDLFSKIINKPDVIIDFSAPKSTFYALNYAVKELIPIVIATTGFTKDEESLIREFSEAIPVFKSSNLSYGINIFSNILAEFSTKINDMDIEIIEKHHRRKIDSPSRNSFNASRKNK